MVRMTMPKEQPAEGVLIETARRNAGLSMREAARRSGISEGWWRQVVKGVQALSGGDRGEVHGPAATIAKMARVVNVTPDQLTGAGREDAARVLAEMLRHPDPAPEPVTSSPLADMDGDQLAKFEEFVASRLTDELEQQIWRLKHYSPSRRIEMIKGLAEARAESREDRNTGNASTALTVS